MELCKVYTGFMHLYDQKYLRMYQVYIQISVRIIANISLLLLLKKKLIQVKKLFLHTFRSFTFIKD